VILAEIGYWIIPAYCYPPCLLLENEDGWREVDAETEDLPWSKLQKAGDMTLRGAYSAVHRYCAPTTGVLQLGQQKSNRGMERQWLTSRPSRLATQRLLWNRKCRGVYPKLMPS